MIALTVRRYLRLGRAVAIGFADGWSQPIELSTSTNVEHLVDPASPEEDVFDLQDRGINLGQIARAGRKSQAWRERWWPLRGAR